MLYLFPLLLPFLSFFILLVSGPFFKSSHGFSRSVVCGVSSFIMALNFFLSYIFFVDLRTGDFLTEVGFFGFLNLFLNSFSKDFFLVNDYSLAGLNYFFDYSFLYDSLTITMILVVVGVSFLVQLFSIEYMHGDLFLVRFFSFLNFFSLCMLVLVTAGNFVQMFVG
jgi:NADH:ubiquinone oxidoreductase subunit 5 (subunit L)/multisubunit Na+/H+ antiporter MnhA subunit